MVGVRTVGVCELFPSQVRGLGYSGGVIVVTNGYDYCISVWRTLVFHQSLNFFFFFFNQTLLKQAVYSTFQPSVIGCFYS